MESLGSAADMAGATYHHGADLQTHSGECLLYAAQVRQRHGDFFRGVRTPGCKVPLHPGLYSPHLPREVFPGHLTSNDSHPLLCLHRAHFPLVSDFSQEHLPRMNLAPALLIIYYCLSPPLEWRSCEGRDFCL